MFLSAGMHARCPQPSDSGYQWVLCSIGLTQLMCYCRCDGWSMHDWCCGGGLC